jgi:hypothetical protein
MMRAVPRLASIAAISFGRHSRWSRHIILYRRIVTGNIGHPSGSVRPPGDQRLDLPLGCPPIMNPDRMIDEDDCVRGVDPPLDRVPGAVAVDQLPPPRKQRFMSSREFCLRHENPIRLPLDFVDRIIRQGMGGADRAAHRRLSAASIAYDHHARHVPRICQSSLNPKPSTSQACSDRSAPLDQHGQAAVGSSARHVGAARFFTPRFPCRRVSPF